VQSQVLAPLRLDERAEFISQLQLVACAGRLP
jgi:hypothetical protein